MSSSKTPAVLTGDVLGWIGRGLRILAEAVATWYERRQAYDELMAFDDHTLADIGITRADIPAVVAGTFVRATISRRGETQYFLSSGLPAPANESQRPQAA